jgi:hypothetical protein
MAKVPGVQVASRTSSFAFKGKQTDVREIGEKLGVTSVLEGSVRKVGNRIRITAQLVNVENGYHLWSETYDRQLEDVFAIQDEISRAISEALKLRLGSDAGQLVVPSKNIEAYNLYLKGRFFFNKFTEQGLRKALDLFQHALLQDPGYARAYAGIADVWCNLADDWVAPDEAYPMAKAAHRKPSSAIPNWPRQLPLSARCSAGMSGTSRAQNSSSSTPWHSVLITPRHTMSWGPPCHWSDDCRTRLMSCERRSFWTRYRPR